MENMMTARSDDVLEMMKSGMYKKCVEKEVKAVELILMHQPAAAVKKCLSSERQARETCWPRTAGPGAHCLVGSLRCLAAQRSGLRISIFAMVYRIGWLDASCC